MTRYTMQHGDITVKYGSDDVLGVFFDINEVASAAATGSYGDGGGVYLALTTGMGIGKKVTKATMVEFMRRYGVPANHLAAVTAGKQF
ncbi:hypothetical protein C8R44DRAFT_984196 [Mycena epipterygia]|nr:hypothetical protein C8R44DRAFT_984196 [Mycena epipterygia]